MSSHYKRKKQLTIALLAAGQAERFGSPKQLALYKEQTFIEQAIRLLCSLATEIHALVEMGFDPLANTVLDYKVIVVTGAHHNSVNEQLTPALGNYEIVYNPNWQQGMSSSIKAAVSHCSNDCDGLMFVTVDQIQITTTDILSLITTWTQDHSYVACAKYAGGTGIPVIFPREYFSRLLELSGDKGAKSILSSLPKINLVPMPNAELDIDTRAQLLDFSKRELMKLSNN